MSSFSDPDEYFVPVKRDHYPYPDQDEQERKDQ